MVSIPRRPASSKARTKFAELPLVDSPTAMSRGCPNAPSCRENTTSTPMSLHSAVTTDVSLASPNAGSGRTPPPGCRNSVAICCASVALPPLPKANSRPPAANLAAISRAHCAIRAPSRLAITRRSSMTSAALATVDARTCSSTAGRSLVPAYRNGYSDSIAVVPPSSGRPVTGSLPHDGDRLAGVHQDRVACRGAHQGDADLLLARAGVHDGQLIGQQPHDPRLDRDLPASETLIAGAYLARWLLRRHVTTPGSSTPGCSKNTCTSSQRMWYVVTCISLITRGSSDAAASRWSTASLAAIRPVPPPARPCPPTRAMVSRPSDLAVSRPASTLPLSPSAEIPSAMSAGPAR